MRTLIEFPAPKDGEITVCRVDGNIHSMNYEFCNVNAFTSMVEKHPSIRITRDLLHPLSGDEGRSLFLPVNVHFLKQLIQTYYEQGMIEVLHVAARHNQFLISKTASLIIKLTNVVDKFRKKVYPCIRHNSFKVLLDVCQTRSWLTSLVRCLAWHPYCTKLAVATSDNCVRIYSSEITLVPILKSKQQRNITCLAWRPLSLTDIAVGCEDSIFVWAVDPASVVTRPSVSHASILYRVDHRPVMSLAWNPQGSRLASAAACDSVILVWNVELNRTSSLKRPSTYGNAFLKWCKSGEKMFSATTGLIFRVWECHTWQAERWNVLDGRVRTACWSPCGRILLFTTSREPLIYALSFLKSDLVFTSNANDSCNSATPLFDLSKVDMDGITVGGIAQSMEWDPKGNHLAVLFEDTNYVAVFNVVLHPVLHLSANCLVAGLQEESPSVIAFQNNFENGACLSIGWSTGRIQHFPIVYTDLTSISKFSNSSHNTSFYKS